MCVRVIFGSVSFTNWPPFWQELLTLSTVRSLCNLTICNFRLIDLVLRAVFGF